MRLFKAAVLTAVLMILAISAFAQSEYPKAELNMGYSMVRLSTTGVLEQFTQQGGKADIAYNFNNKFGFVFDYGGYNNNNIRGYDVDNTMFTYTFGPRFSARGEKFRVFGDVLLGGAHISGSANANLAPCTGTSCGSTTVSHVEESNNSMAFIIGGGVDVNVHKNIALRVGQFDYLLTRFNPGSQSETQNCFRYSAGIVFKWGHTN